MKKKKLPLICVILVNYNGYHDTIECVKSLKRIDYSNYKIIIVDNNSKDKELLREDVFLNDCSTILYSNINGGFSYGNNLGIKCAKKMNADYYLLLNNDTVVNKNLLDELIIPFYAYKEVGITTGNIYYYDNKNRLWYSGGSYNRKNGFTETNLFSSKEVRNKNISFASGCLMLLSRECVEKVGELDEGFFMYSEDTDYCCRVIDSGLKIVWNPRAYIYHKVSSSVGQNTPFQQYYLVRNNLIMIKKYGTFKLFGYLYRMWLSIKEVLHRRYNIKVIICACRDFIFENGKKW